MQGPLILYVYVTYSHTLVILIVLFIKAILVQKYLSINFCPPYVTQYFMSAPEI